MSDQLEDATTRVGATYQPQQGGRWCVHSRRVTARSRTPCRERGGEEGRSGGSVLGKLSADTHRHTKEAHTSIYPPYAHVFFERYPAIVLLVSFYLRLVVVQLHTCMYVSVCASLVFRSLSEIRFHECARREKKTSDETLKHI